MSSREKSWAYTQGPSCASPLGCSSVWVRDRPASTCSVPRQCGLSPWCGYGQTMPLWQETKFCHFAVFKKYILRGHCHIKGSWKTHKIHEVLCPQIGYMSVSVFITLPVLSSWSYALLRCTFQMRFYFFLSFMELFETVLPFVLIPSCTWALWHPEAPASCLSVTSPVDFPALI